MKVFSTVKALQEHLGSLKCSPVGFVPTMGALHPGHISLVKKAICECPATVVSIFVNPTQFNDKSDLERYPRTPEKDLEMLGEILRENDAVFMPGVEEIYPGKSVPGEWDFGNLEKVMEGIYRPGHFKGVAQVVNRLFDIVKPDIAYFGQKDFQQLAIIRDLVRQTGRKIKITGCPVVREPDGLAMSSRNLLLSPEMRKNAGIIYATILRASSMLNTSDIPAIKDYVRNSINATPGFRLEYFEIVDDTMLMPVYEKKDMQPGKNYFGCIAVWAGNVRLIDNIEFSCPVSKG